MHALRPLVRRRCSTILRLAAARAAIDALEPRRLMSDDPLTIGTVKNGADVWLNVVGSANADTIVVDRTAAKTYTITNGAWSVTKTGAFAGVRVTGGAGDDSVTVDGTLVAVRAWFIGEAGNDTLVGGTLNDVLFGGVGDDSITGNAGNDALHGDAGNDTVNGGIGNDAIWGGTENDSLIGDVGNDSILGEAGNDALEGDAGNDTLNGGIGNDTVGGGADNDSVLGDVGDDVLTGDDGNDLLNAGLGDDSIDGGAGNDKLLGDAGTDVYVGGTGIDTLDYTARTVALNITLDGQANDGTTGENDNVGSDLETIIGGTAADSITGDDNVNVLYGGAGNDTIDGGDGNDRVYGGSGADSLSGGLGDDSVYGQTEADKLFGNDGDDLLEGGAGNDQLDGGDGDDHLIAIGGGTADSVTGGNGLDSFWLDSDATEKLLDVSDAEIAAKATHRVKAFVNYGRTAISKDVLGQKLAEPVGTGKILNFAANPLFANGTPNEDDIAQGQTGDCWYLSSLSSLAKAHPEVLKQSITSLGDGTYAVRFINWNNGAEQYVRVDADLYTYSWSSTTSVYANFGAGGATWAALMEKAFTWVRGSKLGNYQTISGGWMSEAYARLGMSSDGRFPGQFNDASAMADWVGQQLNAGKAVTVGFNNVQAGLNLVGSHAYTVDHITDNGDGTFNVTLRNPWGIDNYTSNDGANDGYVTLSMAQLKANFSGLAAA